jgi:hypothetical protein
VEKDIMLSNKVSRSHWALVENRCKAAIAGASLVLGAISMSIFPASAAPQKVAEQSTALPDGIYLYGQSAQPDDLGNGYFVFESKQGQVVGALYMPRSSFDCAAGSFKSDQLALTVTNSYDRITNPLEIALERSTTVASSGSTAPGISLQGFHKLDKVTDNDLRMLNVCKTDLSQQAKAGK